MKWQGSYVNMTTWPKCLSQQSPGEGGKWVMKHNEICIFRLQKVQEKKKFRYTPMIGKDV